MDTPSQLRHFIQGQFTEAQDADAFDLISPVTEQVYRRSPNASAADVDRAYAAAREAFAVWRQTTPVQRQKALLQWADAIEEQAPALIEAQSRNTGQLKHLIATEEVAVAVDQIRFFAGAARCLEGKASGEYLTGLSSTVRREPLGVIGQVTPWNYPLLMAVWKVAPALAAGNTVVLKPSETTPESSLLLAEIAGAVLPEGAFNVVLGDAQAGALVVSHPAADMVCITGSVRAGIQVAAAAASNLTPTHLELGGKAPVLVFEDADLEKAATAIATAGYFNAGQDCTAASRVIVAAAVHDELVQRLVEQSQATRFGLPDDQEALYGPLNNARQLQRVQGFIERLPAHARIQTGGQRAEQPGYYFEPTLITDLQQGDEVIQTEVFGPVITVQSFADEAEAILKANGVEYGLAASVWTRDHARALRLTKALDFGCVWVNTHIPLAAEMPHGGFKHSGHGKDLSAYSLDAYTRIKHVMSALD